MLANTQAKIFDVVDVRAVERFKGIKEPIDPVAGHIPNSINLPLTENLDDNGYFKSAENLHKFYRENLPDFNSSKMTFMCGSGVTACHSILALKVAGFGDAKLYAGSWSEWIRSPGNPVETEI